MTAAHGSFVHARCGGARGFSLIEVMVALTLGLLLTIGIVTVFSATSSSSKVQDALARLQENGRYAAIRIAGDLRMLGGQYCATSSTEGARYTGDTNGTVYPSNAILSYAPGAGAPPPLLSTTNNALPDGGGTVGSMPSGTDLTVAPYALSPTISAIGYDCALTDANCAAVPTGPNPADGLPLIGVGDGLRVQGTDVLTLRYQTGTGWPYAVTGIGQNTVLILAGKLNDDPVAADTFRPGDRALVSVCAGGKIFQAAVAGTPPALQLSPDPAVPITPTFRVEDTSVGRTTTFDARVFNFTKNFVTVTYYVAYQADPTTSGRLIPTLMRKQNGGGSVPGGSTDALVQGVERLDFLYGVQYKSDGNAHLMTATDVNTNSVAANCALPPSVTVPAGCLWGSVKTVEVHMLLDSVNNQPLSADETSFFYTIDGNSPAARCQPPASQAAPMLYCAGAAKVGNGSTAGQMMRREFVSTIAVRNGNL